MRSVTRLQLRSSARRGCLTVVRASSTPRRDRQSHRRRPRSDEDELDALRRPFASLALGAAVVGLSSLLPLPLPLPTPPPLLSAPPARAAGIPEPRPPAPPAPPTVDEGVPLSDGTLKIKFLASPDPRVREAQTALVEAWGHVSTAYFDHTFGGVDWRGALQRALDESFVSRGSDPSESVERTYDALDSMLSELGDPYTRFLRPLDAGSYAAGAEGEGLSLGIQLQKKAAAAARFDDDGAVVVAAVVPGSPADLAGISRGDELVAVDGRRARGRNVEDLALSLTREADVTYAPASKDGKKSTPRTVHLEPATVSLHSVQWARLETKGDEDKGRVSYVRVAAFNRLAPADVSRALDLLFPAGSESDGEHDGVLLVDLRDNGGGAVDAGVDVASLLLPRDERGGRRSFLFGSVRDGAGNEERVTIDGSRGKLPSSRVAVLVNGGTASTSELVAAALRGEGSGEKKNSSSVSSDALLVGEKTFKKARTQRAVPLTGGGLLLVSNLQYVSPRGEAVDGVGLTPDVRCEPEKVERSFFVSGGGDEASAGDEESNAALLARDLLYDPCVRAAAEALGATLADPPSEAK